VPQSKAAFTTTHITHRSTTRATAHTVIHNIIKTTRIDLSRAV
jgi:hypothetical protein